MNKNNYDHLLNILLDLDGQRYVVDDALGLWVKFDIKRVNESQSKPYGIKYNLTLHDRSNNRILGFDNVHAIEYGGKSKVRPKRTYEHLHSNKYDKGKPYSFVNAGKLLEDFWVEVDKVLTEYKRA